MLDRYVCLSARLFNRLITLQTVDYSTARHEGPAAKVRRGSGYGSDSDTDFMTQPSDDHHSADEELEKAVLENPNLLQDIHAVNLVKNDTRSLATQATNGMSNQQAFRAVPNSGFSAVNKPRSSPSNQWTKTTDGLSTAPFSVQKPPRPEHSLARSQPNTVASQATHSKNQLASSKSQTAHKPFRRSATIWPDAVTEKAENPIPHFACGTHHAVGHCPIKLAGPETCNLCGLAHFGIARTCPHIQSETQVRAMLVALKQSSEDSKLVQEASRYLQGVKGTLVQAKKIKAEKEAKLREAAFAGLGPPLMVSGPPPNIDWSRSKQASAQNGAYEVHGIAPYGVGSNGGQGGFAAPSKPHDVDLTNAQVRREIGGSQPAWLAQHSQLPQPQQSQ